MEKTRIVPAIYGYAVCLIAVIVMLVSVSSVVNAIINLQDPIRANTMSFGFGPSANLSSFEAYKIDILTGRSNPVTTQTTPVYTPTDAELKVAYDTAKEDRIATVKQDATRSIINSIVMLIVAGVLFKTHWGWVTGMKSNA